MKIGKKTIDGFEEFVFSETLTSDYEDITSVSNFVKIGNYMFKDYKWIRARLLEESVNWDSLSSNDQVTLCRYKACSTDDATTRARSLATLGEDFDYWRDDFDTKSRQCRQARFTRAKTILINNVSLTDRYIVLSILDSNPSIENNYIKHGVEGLNYGDPIAGLYDFIEATNSFALNGIAAQSPTMIGDLTKAQMISKMLDCLKNGNY